MINLDGIVKRIIHATEKQDNKQISYGEFQKWADFISENIAPNDIHNILADAVSNSISKQSIDWIIDKRHIVLGQSDLFFVGLSEIDPNEKSIAISPAYTRAMVCGPSPVTCQTYNWHGETYEAVTMESRLNLRSEEKILPGGYVFINGLNEAKFFSTDDGSRGLLFLVSSLPLKAVEWFFDRKSKAPFHACAMDSEASQSQFLCKMLLALPNEEIEGDRLDLLQKLCSHPVFFVRWQALQTLSNFDTDRTVDTLRIMAGTDAHPELSAKARKALKVHGYS